MRPSARCARYATRSVAVARDGLDVLDVLLRTGAYAHRSLRDLPTLVLLDLGLPHVDGLEVLACLKQEPDTQPIPVLLLLAGLEERAQVERQGLHAEGYLVKPFAFPPFATAVCAVGLTAWLIDGPPTPRNWASSPH
jgi:CheY-like chemotaxis protein